MRRALLCFALLACHRKGAEPFPAPASVPAAAPSHPGTPPPAGEGAAEVFVARDAEPILNLEAPGTLIVGVPVAVPTTVPPVAPRAHPPADALADLQASLTTEGQAFAPKPDALPFYEVTVRVDPERGALAGHVELDWQNQTGGPLSSLPFRLFANATGPHLAMARLARADGQAALAPSPDPTLLPVALSPPLAAGAWLHLAYDVVGTVPVSVVAPGGALAASLLSETSRAPDYGLFARFPNGVSLADWLPMVAARFESSFDTGAPSTVGDTAFSEVADFRAAVELPADYRLASAGALLGEERTADHFLRTRLALAAGRDLALFAGKGYRSAEATEGQTQVRVVFAPGHATQGQQVLAAARHALGTLSAKLTPYPWTQLTAVDVPLGGGAGGAEFSGVVAIAGMFFESKANVGLGIAFNGPFLESLREFTVTHEVAHQWFAIQVGSHPRLEPDVDEPLAQAAAAIALTPQGGKRERREVFDRQVAINYQAMRLMQGEDGPAARATHEFESTTVYAGLVYGKAPMFYAELASSLGDSAFWNGLGDYVKAYRFKTARRGDVLDSFSSLMPRARLDALYTRWFGEAHGDEDLAGRGDPMAMAGALFGSASDPEQDPDSLPPNLDEMLKQAREALGAAAAGKGDTQASEQPLLDPKQAEQLLKTLDQSMGGLSDLPQQ